MVMMLLYLLCVIHVVLRTGVDTLGTRVYIETGKNVTLNCSFEEKVQWLFKTKDSNELEVAISDNKLIKDNFSAHYAIIGDETYNLQIINATHSNEGRYWCFTTNVTDNESVQYFQLRLKVPPSEVWVIHISKVNTIIGKEKENLTLACYTLGGIPRGKTMWYHGMKKLAMNNDNSEWTNYSFILDKNHNGQIYTCIAEHDMLATPLEQTIKLNIMYHPRVQCLWPKESVSVGHDVNVSCSYYSNPLDAEILWTKNCQNIGFNYSIVTKIAVGNDRNWTKIEDMTKYDHSVTAIMIKNVTRSDAGAYTCSVTNTEGSASETIYLAVQDNGSETITDSGPPYSVKGFLAKEQILYGVFIVLLVLVLIIISLVAHVYIWNRCTQTNYAVPQREVVRHSPIEIEMQEVYNNEEDVHEEPRNILLLSEILPVLQSTASGDRQSDFSKTNTSQSSSSHSNRSQNEEDYLHPYHGFVHSGLGVHEYATVDVQESTEYEEITNTF